MKTVTLLSQVDNNKCIGCRTCERVCPVLAIKVVNRKAVVEAERCRACANCEQRCPVNAVTMVKRETPLEVGVDVNSVNYDDIKKLCRKAKLNPEQTICYCVGVRAEEVAAAILKGAKTPEEVSLTTGARTGCSVECIQPILRLLEAAGHALKPVEGGWQWYGRTVTAWDLPEAVKQKYSARGFYFEEDRKVLDEIVEDERTEGEK
jgi:ferredoxin